VTRRRRRLAYCARSYGVNRAKTKTRCGALAFGVGTALTVAASAMTQTLQIVLASDLAERSRCALVRAVQLKRATAAGLTVLHVAEPGLVGELAESRRAAAMAKMEAQFSEVSAGRLRRVLIKVVLGDPVSAIVAEAESRDADLVVLGQPGKHRIKELFAGTTAEQVIRQSRRPVLVAKVRSDQPYRRVVIAFDRSEAAQRALAIALALAPRAEFYLVYASQRAQTRRGEEEAERMQELLEDAAKQVTRRSLYRHTRLTIEVREGAPVHTIASALQAFDADLLAMGTHGRGTLQAALFGSVAQGLMAASPCDALVTRPQWRQ
jgi:nucleotide-binding universal stress UspA family protein